nr:MAG TPA: glycoprotein [Caudoviricetes sp.]
MKVFTVRCPLTQCPYCGYWGKPCNCPNECTG